eukprot:CAMPEP_0198327276 /NCGR_PEP_ID=MMETSP1450-20131203/14572_1 /TAXON_ID=753684 ORGANISM="Madagascaria erythrocladiodes, Strain CCMP3234" /NCGR_SAMPLE_ID=MMETSP1450 /ASSEMBLY_ACC=CAM_ASM_001115 /LENGTH=470 /DNA_ID=CAMNT_0044031313 /DNA_START=44 /DNA_END=1453 /DNA_ORIENTATION=+
MYTTRVPSVELEVAPLLALAATAARGDDAREHADAHDEQHAEQHEPPQVAHDEQRELQVAVCAHVGLGRRRGAAVLPRVVVGERGLGDERIVERRVVGVAQRRRCHVELERAPVHVELLGVVGRVEHARRADAAALDAARVDVEHEREVGEQLRVALDVDVFAAVEQVVLNAHATHVAEEERHGVPQAVVHLVSIHLARVALKHLIRRAAALVRHSSAVDRFHGGAHPDVGARKLADAQRAPHRSGVYDDHDGGGVCVGVHERRERWPRGGGRRRRLRVRVEVDCNFVVPHVAHVLEEAAHHVVVVVVVGEQHECGQEHVAVAATAAAPVAEIGALRERDALVHALIQPLVASQRRLLFLRERVVAHFVPERRRVDHHFERGDELERGGVRHGERLQKVRPANGVVVRTGAAVRVVTAHRRVLGQQAARVVGRNLVEQVVDEAREQLVADAADRRFGEARQRLAPHAAAA